jgi:hypothetical protein
MTLATEISRFPPLVELPRLGARADDGVQWTIADQIRTAQGADQIRAAQGLGFIEQIKPVLAPGALADHPGRIRQVLQLNARIAQFDTTMTEGWHWQEPHPLLLDSADDPANASALATPSAISINRTRLSRAGLTADAYSRLIKIATRAEGWRGPGSRALQSASLVGFSNFWSLICGQAVEPEFTLLPNGHLGIEWYKNSRRHVDLEFVDDQMAYFGFFNGATEIEGKANVRVIAQLMMTDSARPLRWESR